MCDDWLRSPAALKCSFPILDQENTPPSMIKSLNSIRLSNIDWLDNLEVTSTHHIAILMVFTRKDGDFHGLC